MDFSAFQISSVSIFYYECANLYMEILIFPLGVVENFSLNCKINLAFFQLCQ